MSGPSTRVSTSAVPCRYWAASGTCFFGDQCNFAHNLADKGSAGRSAVPKRERACRELLLYGFCKNEKNGCEYNHDIPGVTQTGPTAPPPTAGSSAALQTAAVLQSSRSLDKDEGNPVPVAAGDSRGAETSPLGAHHVTDSDLQSGLRETVEADSSTEGTPSGYAASSETQAVASDAAFALASGLSIVEKQPMESSIGTEIGPSKDSKEESSASLEVTSASTEGADPSDSATPAPSQPSQTQSKSKTLPISAPAFVPAAVAAAQRVALTAWGGGSPGTAGLPPSGISPGVAAAANAPPFVPKSKQLAATGRAPSPSLPPSSAAAAIPSSAGPSLHTTPRPTVTYSSFSNRQQVTMQQPQAQSLPGRAVVGSGLAPGIRPTTPALVPTPGSGPKGGVGAAVGSRVTAGGGLSRSSGSGLSSSYKELDGGVSAQSFALPDGDDPSLGMTSMSPPQAGTNSLESQAGSAVGVSGQMLPILRPPDGVSAMGSVGERAGRGGGGPPGSAVRYARGRFGSSLRVGNGFVVSGGIMSSRPGTSPGISGGQVAGSNQPQRPGLQKSQMGSEAGQPQGTGPIVGKDGLFVPTDVKGFSGGVSDAVFDASGKDLGDKSPRQKQARHAHMMQSSLAQTQLAHQKHIQAQAFYQLPHHSAPMGPVQAQQNSYQRMQMPQRQGTPPLQQSSTQLQSSHSQRLSSGNPHNLYRPTSPGPSLATTPVVAAATHGGATYFFGPRQGLGAASVQQMMGAVGNYGGGGGGVRRDAIGRTGNVVGTPGRMPLASKFISEDLRKELLQRSALIQAQLDPEQDMVDLPDTVQHYHMLYPLEDFSAQDEVSRSAFGVRSIVFKGISSSDGRAYAIRRIDHRQVIPTAELAAAAAEAVERWAALTGHPHVTTLREAFVSREIEDSPALFFVHDYYPAAVTLEVAHLSQNTTSGVVHLTVSEEQLWSYLVQLAAALRAIHGAGLHCRMGGLDPSKVLLTSRGRLRIGGVGVLDVLNGDEADDPRLLQREDLAGCGRLLLNLACGSVLNSSLDFMAAHFSPDLVRITQALLASSPDNAEGGGLNSIRQLYAVLAERMFGEIEQVHMRNDNLLDELSKECDNGRLFRLMVKLATVNERPDDDLEPGWSETGDRYLLKLFRDFVFHQSTEDGRPIVDWGHIIESLNKLDAGVPEKVVLISRDQRSMLIVSYRDLLRCLQTSYAQLSSRALGDSGHVPLPAALVGGVISGAPGRRSIL